MNLFPLDKFTLDEFTWALSTVRSHSIVFILPEGEHLIMPPFTDMLNHLTDVLTCHRYDQTMDTLHILVGKEYNEEDQVYINYGPASNNHLACLYSFALPNNPYNSYDLVLHIESTTIEKHALFHTADLNHTSVISLTLQNPLPGKVLQYLCIQCLVGVEYKMVTNTAKLVIWHNEFEILGALIEALTCLLDGFPTSANKLQYIIDQGEFVFSSNA
ncbi:hypothetical protein BC937DRAFT_95550 [Endogone sp. FLAS-F59071]|nr:hypothetical protein BC937DRAFT_95550 [Endogone sp. FLAS-F59071]|eukprot:RUS13290.1 hypothetical protein BC937DRAFT_95550 [Endogone sp. FLAS-F59071]